jgi:uncharacterized DUF497 family protein
MKVDWDDTKADVNERKHGISFAEAATIFSNSYLEIKDDSSGEERGEDTIRIISARKATKKERKEYEKEKK